MHRCEEFRERIAEFIMDRAEIADHELLICPGCAEFYAQAREALEALDQVEASISGDQWHGIENRLRRSITAAALSRESRRRSAPLLWAPLLAAAALLLITISFYRWPHPAPSVPSAANGGEPPITVAAERSVPLDPVTVDFLQQSELLLRTVMKIRPGDARDLADAKKVASAQLPELGQRKEAASAAPRVVRVMDTYETILRDIRNIDRQTAGEDISDIQMRIRRNRLIDGMQAGVTEARFVLR